MTQEERVEGFKKGIEALQKEFQVELRVFLNVTNTGIIPILQLFDTSPEALAENQKEDKKE